MMDFLVAVENSGFSMWLKENSTPYVAVLAFHTVGLAFLVGISCILALRILGVTPGIPLKPMQGFFPLMWLGLSINAVTGSLMLTEYPSDYFVDFSFYIKLSSVAIALVMLRKMQNLLYGEGVDPDVAAESNEVKLKARIMLCAWVLAIWGGRVTAYSIPTKYQTLAALLVFLTIALVVIRIFGRKIGLISEPVQVHRSGS
jgi:hypothetical protein